MFHVFVEGPTDPSPEAHEKLAAVMSERYGLPIADVKTRLAKGRFRVKANVDRATADMYLSDLGAVGAKVKIEEAKASSPSLPVPSTTATPAAGLPAATPSAPPATGLRTATSPVAATPPKGVTNPPFASGLAAAFEPSNAAQDLGALGGDSGSFALSSVDGHESSTATDSPFNASFGPPAEAPPKPAPRAQTPKPIEQEAGDMFAPPDAEDDNQKVEIAADEIADQARRRSSATPRSSAPPPSVPVVATPQLQRKQTTAVATGNHPVTALAPRGRLGPLSEPRNRFALGVFVMILLGFVPTHFIATFREHDAFRKIDDKYVTDAANAIDPPTWSALDEPALRDKKSAQKDIMLTSLAMWALFAAGIGYVWFRRVPWDKLDAVG